MELRRISSPANAELYVVVAEIDQTGHTYTTALALAIYSAFHLSI